MNQDEEIRRLAARFMAGETSLDEERRLYRYFSGNEVAADLLPMREFFCSLSAMMPLEKPETERKRQPVRLLSRQTFIGIAASIALLVVVGVGGMLWRTERQDYCEAYIYNKHVTAPATVMKEVDETLQAICQDGELNVDGQLHDIFGNQ